MNNGTRNGIDHLNRYPKKLGISTPDDSAIDLTMKFGALPIYVFAPIKTAPAEIANNVFFSSPIKVIGSPKKKNQKFRLQQRQTLKVLILPEGFESESITLIN